MVESKKVLLEKVDNSENVVDSLIKSMSIEKISWCREAMGIYVLAYRSDKVYTPYLYKESNEWENVGYVLYSL